MTCPYCNLSPALFGPKLTVEATEVPRRIDANRLVRFPDSGVEWIVATVFTICRVSEFRARAATWHQCANHVTSDFLSCSHVSIVTFQTEFTSRTRHQKMKTIATPREGFQSAVSEPTQTILLRTASVNTSAAIQNHLKSLIVSIVTFRD